MLSSALLSLGVAGSALAWPSHPRHSSIARALHARQEPAVAPKAPVAATWFASWHAQDFPLSNVSWNKYTTVTYSFALTTPNVSFVSITDPEVFKDFVETAHANNVSASISVGGWTGSRFFSPAVATAENRTAFVKTMTDLVKDNNLDGLDFDWEYPGLAGIGCNSVSANDTDNFLAFLTELRTALPNTTISAATSIKPFISSDLTTPSTNVSAFAAIFDYIAIMNYDIWGPWSDTVGPNAPLNDTCATNATQQVGSAVSAVKAWTTAGFPADQIVLGVAGYGHGFSVASSDALTADNTISPYAPFNKTVIPLGDAWDDEPAANTTDVCGNPQTVSGTWNFWGLVEGGFLNENGTANTAEGIVYKFDECSQTPYVYNKTSGIMVAFDDATSFAAKGQFINTTGLRGFALWEAGGDFDDILLDSIRGAAGFPAVVVEEEDNCNEVETGNGSTGSGSGSTSGSSNGSTGSNSGPSNSAASTNNGASTGSNTGSSNTGSNTNTSNGSTGGSTDPDDEYEEYECDDDGEPITTTAAAAATPTSTPNDEYEDCDDEEPETAVPTTPAAAVAAANPTTNVAAGSSPTTNAAANPATGASSTTVNPSPEPTADPEDDEECEEKDDVTTSVVATATATTTSAPASTASATEAALIASVTESSSTVTVTESTATATESTATVTESTSVTATASATYTYSADSTTGSATSTSVTESASTSSAPKSTASASESTTEAQTTYSQHSSTTEAASSSAPEPTSSAPGTSSEAQSSTYAPEPTSSAPGSTSSAPSSTPEPSSSTVEPTTSSTEAPSTTSSTLPASSQLPTPTFRR